MNLVTVNYTTKTIVEDNVTFTLFNFPFHNQSIWINNSTGKAEDVEYTPLVHTTIDTVEQLAAIEAERIYEYIEMIS